MCAEFVGVSALGHGVGWICGEAPLFYETELMELCPPILGRGKYGVWESPRRSSIEEGFWEEVVSGLSSEKGAAVTLLVGNYIGHAQAWHFERNTVRWGCTQARCGGDSEGQLAPICLECVVSSWGGKGVSVFTFRHLGSLGTA